MNSADATQQSDTSPGLRRELGLWTLVAFGVGDMLGAGIYALIGEVAGRAGGMAWVSFLIILGVAFLTALSYAELGSRFPRSGGESYFCQQAFGLPPLAMLVGFLVCLTGLVSLATVSRAFAGYLREVTGWGFTGLDSIVVIVFLSALAGVAFRGIRESSAANVVCTVVEFGGLLFVVGAGLMFLGREGNEAVAADVEWTWLGVLQGSALAFFAFIGFEDMVNVAEEVENPKRNMPIAILLALSVAAGLYMMVAWVATSVVPTGVLADSQGPLLDVVRVAAPAVPEWSFTCVALFAVANTALLNLVMGSRLMYGMAGQKLLPAGPHAVHETTRTPHRTIALMFTAALVLGLTGTVSVLAGTTNVLLLLVFFIVNLCVIILRVRNGPAASGFRVPLILPAVGATTCLALIAFIPRGSLATAAVLLALTLTGVGVWTWTQRKRLNRTN